LLLLAFNAIVGKSANGEDILMILRTKDMFQSKIMQ
jgi:hypothetical protein